MSFLGLENKTILVFGVANRKSVAYFVGRTLAEEGANVVYVVRSAARKESVAPILGSAPIHVCDVEQKDGLEKLAAEMGGKYSPIQGIVHSIAFANYSAGWKPFHETVREDFLQATQISCFSLVEMARAFKPLMARDASVVSISISSTRVVAENYGYMAPIKAALDSTICFLAKSFSADSEIRFNSVNPGLLKTSASAGIPGYIDSYLYAEQMTLRKKALQTQEVANAVLFLLSQRSSGINGQGLVIDAGMGLNFFDKDLVRKVMKADS